MEIEINDTPAATDDLVQIKCDRVARRPLVNCRIRATAACSVDSAVVLTNPDGRLRFTGPADRTATVTVPENRSWVSFQVSGETGSAAIGDAVIEAHCHTATGPLKASKPMTVFWFDQAQCNLTPGGAYQIDALGVFTSNAPPAITMVVQARMVGWRGLHCSTGGPDQDRHPAERPNCSGQTDRVWAPRHYLERRRIAWNPGNRGRGAVSGSMAAT
jgi:hypothetical protein